MSDALVLENVSFSYGNNKVIENFSLSVEEGSFTTLLGSSGSGKTTLLRLISGFLEPGSGSIKINGQTVNGITPEKRKIGMVFQDYALFPHMTVYQNILYGLKIKNSKAAEKENQNALKQKVIDVAKMLDVESQLEKYPSELSGGQQQRVALGRALVLEPGILLMDEPLSSLDTKLRYTVRNELKEIQKRLKITTIYVTHDQEEALALSDKIAVLNNGKLVQYGTSHQIYTEPADRFTADFIGAANFFEANGTTFMVRPEWIEFSAPDSGDLKGTVKSQEYLGSKIRYQIETTQGIFTTEVSAISEGQVAVGEITGMKFLLRKEIKN